MLELQILPALSEMAKHPLGVQQSGQAAGQGGQAAAAALRQYPLGFSTGDATSDLAATILRMLYIKDLRALQTLVDQTIVQVQVRGRAGGRHALLQFWCLPPVAGRPLLHAWIC